MGLAGRWRRRKRLWFALALLVAAAAGIRFTVAVFQARSQPRIAIVDVAPSAQPEVANVVCEAAEVLETLIKRFADQPDSWHALAQYYFKFGKLDDALACWKRCVELAPADSQGHFWLGYAARQEGNSDAAVESFRKALECAPRSPEVCIALAQALIDLGQMEEAIGVLEKNLAAYPQSIPSYVLLGEINVQLKEYERAKQSFETVIAAWPDHTAAYYGLARACGALDETAQAERYMERFEQLRAQDEKEHREFLKTRTDLPGVQRKVSEVFTLAGQAYLAGGDVETAEKLLLRAGELCSSQVECHRILSWLYERQGRIDEAHDALVRGSKANPDDVGAHHNLGTFLARRGRFEEAETAFKRAIETAPHLGGGYAALAGLYLTSNRSLPEAEKLAAKAVELEPLAKNYYLVAVACLRNEKLPQAQSAIKHAIALEPANAEYRRMHQTLHQDQAE